MDAAGSRRTRPASTEGAPIRPSCRDGKDTPRAMLSEGDILGPEHATPMVSTNGSNRAEDRKGNMEPDLVKSKTGSRNSN